MVKISEKGQFVIPKEARELFGLQPGDEILALDDKVCREMEELKSDCMVADSMALWGKAVALKLSIPFVSSTTTFAFKTTDYQIIMSVGNLVSLKELENLPENISAYPYVDQISVLKKTDVFVSHCGMNSVGESLYFEVPIVLLTQTAEQNGVAEQVLRLGAGIKPKATDGASVMTAVNEILCDSSYKQNAAKISNGFKKCSGARGAADKIMDVCNEHIL